MEKFWVVWVSGTDGGFHYQHTRKNSAEEEAKRLARLNPGKEVYVMELVSCCKTHEPVEWLSVTPS